MSRSQTIGIALIIAGIILQFLTENTFLQITAGAICAVGIGVIFKWIPFKKNG